jgi:hypothetical protein
MSDEKRGIVWVVLATGVDGNCYDEEVQKARTEREKKRNTQGTVGKEGKRNS